MFRQLVARIRALPRGPTLLALAGFVACLCVAAVWREFIPDVPPYSGPYWRNVLPERYPLEDRSGNAYGRVRSYWSNVDDSPDLVMAHYESWFSSHGWTRYAEPCEPDPDGGYRVFVRRYWFGFEDWALISMSRRIEKSNYALRVERFDSTMANIDTYLAIEYGAGSTHYLCVVEERASS